MGGELASQSDQGSIVGWRWTGKGARLLGACGDEWTKDREGTRGTRFRKILRSAEVRLGSVNALLCVGRLQHHRN